MKTSTKLIIVLFTCLLLSLLAYNLLLKNEYDKRRFSRDFRPSSNVNYTPAIKLRHFSHVVINGSLKMLEEGSFEVWMAKILICGKVDSSTSPNNSISVIQELKNNMIATVKNDTLYISFRVRGKYDHQAQTWSNANNIVQIFSNHISSIDVSYANVTIRTNPSRVDSLKLTASNGIYDINSLSIKNLIVSGRDSSSFNIQKTNRINELRYSIKGKSRLSIDENPVLHFNALQVDSSAEIQIGGNARGMQKQLQ